MGTLSASLQINPEQTTQQIEGFIKLKLADLGRDGVLIGLSGGLDSAVAATLAVRAVGAGQVQLLNLPEKDSRDLHQEHAAIIAEALGVELQTQALTPLLEELGIYDLLPTSRLPGKKLQEWSIRLGRGLVRSLGNDEYLHARLAPTAGSLVAKGNAYASIKHRLRMVLLYHRATIANLMVVGAANRTEWLTGTFSMWGCDHCADVMPLLHLYRSQLDVLAQYLDVPQDVRSKAADPDVVPGVHDKEALLGSFRVTDEILWGLERDVPLVELEVAYGAKMVGRIAGLYKGSEPMRAAPYCLSND